MQAASHTLTKERLEVVRDLDTFASTEARTRGRGPPRVLRLCSADDEASPGLRRNRALGATSVAHTLRHVDAQRQL